MFYGPAKGQRTFIDRQGRRYVIDPSKRLFEHDLLVLGTERADPELRHSVREQVCGRPADASQPTGC